MRVTLLVLVTALLLTASPAAGAQRDTSGHRTQLGILGDSGRFRQLTGQRSAVLHAFIGWDQPGGDGTDIYGKIYDSNGEAH